jgi:hypothetical protein
MHLLPKRRWLRFSVRTLLIAVTIFCVWLGWASRWVTQRRHAVDRSTGVFRDGDGRTPWSLWLLGERGAATIVVHVHGKTLQDANARAEQLAPELKRLQRLFPEAEIKTLRNWPYMDLGDFVPRRANNPGPPQPLPPVTPKNVP